MLVNVPCDWVRPPQESSPNNLGFKLQDIISRLGQHQAKMLAEALSVLLGGPDRPWLEVCLHLIFVFTFVFCGTTVMAKIQLILQLYTYGLSRRSESARTGSAVI